MPSFLSVDKKARIWLEAMRPKTWIASVAPVLFGTCLAHYLGSFNPLIFFATLLAGLSIQIGTNLANDYFDWKKGADTESRIGPRRVMQAALVEKSAMIRAITLSFLLAALFCSYLYLQGGTIILFLLLLAVVLGVGYTAGPFPLAYLGWGDFFVLTFFGAVATGMTTYLQTRLFYPEAFLLGLSPGALSTAILTINNLRDYETDTTAAKKTLVVRFGRGFGKLEFLFMILLAQIIPFILIFCYGLSWKLSLLHLLFLPALALLKELFRAEKAEDFLPLLPKTALYFIVYTITGAYALLF